MISNTYPLNESVALSYRFSITPFRIVPVKEHLHEVGVLNEMRIGVRTRTIRGVLGAYRNGLYGSMPPSTFI